MKVGWVAPPSAARSASRRIHAIAPLYVLLALSTAPGTASAASPSAPPRDAERAPLEDAFHGEERAVFWVYLADRGTGDPTGLARALDDVEARMTAASRARRMRGSSGPFRAEESDLPVSPVYLRRIERAGAHVRHA